MSFNSYHLKDCNRDGPFLGSVACGCIIRIANRDSALEVQYIKISRLSEQKIRVSLLNGST